MTAIGVPAARRSPVRSGRGGAPTGTSRSAAAASAARPRPRSRASTRVLGWRACGVEVVVQAGEPGRAGQHRGRGERADAALGVDPALLLQLGQRLPHGRAPDAQRRGQVGLGRDRHVGSVRVAVQDRRDRPGRLEVERLRADSAHPPPAQVGQRLVGDGLAGRRHACTLTRGNVVKSTCLDKCYGPAGEQPGGDRRRRLMSAPLVSRAPGGGFAMVANDGRESLRGDAPRPGRRHRRRAHDVDSRPRSRASLGQHCSAMLMDLMYALPALDTLAAVAPDTGRIVLAVDRFEEPRFGPLAATSLDRDLMRAEARPPATCTR